MSKPYVECAIGGAECRTEAKKGLSVEYDRQTSTFQFLVDVPKQQSLIVRVFNADVPGKKDSKIASARIPIGDLLSYLDEKTKEEDLNKKLDMDNMRVRPFARKPVIDEAIKQKILEDEFDSMTPKKQSAKKW